MAENEHKTIQKFLITDNTGTLDCITGTVDKVNELVAAVNKLSLRIKDVEANQKKPRQR